MADEKANEPAIETEEVQTEEFVPDEVVQQRIDDENSIVDEEPTVPLPDMEEVAEQETEEVDSVEDGGVSGGTTQPDPAAAPMQSPWNESHFEWGRYLNLSRDEVQNFSGGPAAFERMIGQVSHTVGENYEQPDNTGFDLGEDFEDDDALVKMNKHYSDQMSVMRDEIDQLRGVSHAFQSREQHRIAKQSADEFDSICNTMDESMFGRGSYDDLGPDTAENREALANAVSRLGHGYAARREQVPPMGQLVKEAFGATFGGSIENQTLRKVSEKSKQMGSQTTAVPTHKDPEPLSAEQKAVQAAYQWQKEKGWIT